MGKGQYEALYWLNKFINYFEKDYNLWLEECKDLFTTPEDELDEEDKELKHGQKKFMDDMFYKQFPAVIEIILIYSQKNKCSDLVHDINKKVLQLVLEIMKDENDFENIFKTLKAEFSKDKEKAM